MRTILACFTATLLGCGAAPHFNPDGGGSDAHARTDAHAGSHDAGRLDARIGAPDAGEAGPPCYANTDCVGGTCSYSATICVNHSCTTSSACPGTCVPYARQGGFCLAGPPPACAPDSGLVCDPFSHLCVSPSSETLPTVDAGAACGLGVANCDLGSFCYAPVFPDNGTCLPLGHDGGACPPSSVLGSGCAGQLVCVGYGGSADAGTCRSPAAVGATCLPPPPAGDGTGSSGCSNGALCVDGGCVALPTTGPCLDGQCLPDAGYCTSTGTCARWAANGAACTSNSECSSQLCASTTSTCVAELPLGAECGDPYDCTGGLCAGDAPGCASGICDMTGHCATSSCSRPGG